MQFLQRMQAVNLTRWLPQAEHSPIPICIITQPLWLIFILSSHGE